MGRPHDRRSDPGAPGEVTEWSKVHAWRACVGFTPYRGFESHPLRFPASYGRPQGVPLRSLHRAGSHDTGPYRPDSTRALDEPLAPCEHSWQETRGRVSRGVVASGDS